MIQYSPIKTTLKSKTRMNNNDSLSVSNELQEPIVVTKEELVDSAQPLLEPDHALLNNADANGESALPLAAINGQTDVVESLLDQSADIHIENKEHNKTPLQLAVEDGHCDKVEILLNAGDVYIPLTDMQLDLIHIAATEGHVEIVKLLLEKDRTLLNKTDVYGQTALLWAASRGRKNVVEYLLGQGADIHMSTNCLGNENHGKTPLQWAVEGGHLDVVVMLLDAGAIYTPLGSMLLDLIHIAAQKGHTAIVKLLLEKDRTLLNKTAALGQTALLYAAYCGRKDVVEYLLGQGADMHLSYNQTGNANHGKTPLQWAVGRGHRDAVEMLLDAGAVYTPLTEMQFDLIHIAAKEGHLDIVKLLLERNRTLLNKTDAHGQTALIWGANPRTDKPPHLSVVQYLISEGADLNIATTRPGHTDHGKTALVWAVERGNRDVVEMLLDAGAVYTPLDSRPYDLIHMTAQEGHVDIVKLLLEKDRSLLNKTDGCGQTALLWAASRGRKNVVEYLLGQGADIHMSTNCPGNENHGKTPLQWAVEGGHIDVVVMLLDATPLNSMQLDLIHIAAKKGHVDIVKLLLEKDRTLLNKTDANGQTALLYATQCGRKDVVEYLIGQAADFNIPTNRPGNEHHGKTPLQWAIENRQYSSANLLIHKSLNEENQETIFDFINTAELAFEFMILDPKNTELIFNNPRIKPLIDEWNHKSDQHIHYYKSASRRPSFYVEIDKVNGQSVVFNPGKVIGEGTYGKVMDFSSDAGEHRAVKYLKNKDASTWIDFEYNYQVISAINECNREQIFRKKAYPGVTGFFDFKRNKKNGEKQIKQYSIRDIMDYIEGKTLSNFFKKTLCINEIVKYFLLTMEELSALHDKGIIHGDIKENNIMISTKGNEPKVIFIDFGCSYFLTDKFAVSMSNNSDYIAPERHKSPIKPHTNQDIYSLGYMFGYLLDRQPKKHEIEYLFPSIRKFINASLDIKPRKRPLLTAFHDELTAESKNIKQTTPSLEPLIEMGHFSSEASKRSAQLQQVLNEVHFQAYLEFFEEKASHKDDRAIINEHDQRAQAVAQMARNLVVQLMQAEVNFLCSTGPVLDAKAVFITECRRAITNSDLVLFNQNYWVNRSGVRAFFSTKAAYVTKRNEFITLLETCLHASSNANFSLAY